MKTIILECSYHNILKTRRAYRGSRSNTNTDYNPKVEMRNMWDVNSGQLHRAILAPALTAGSPTTFVLTTSQPSFGPVLLLSLLTSTDPRTDPSKRLRSISPSRSQLPGRTQSVATTKIPGTTNVAVYCLYLSLK